MQDNSKLLLDLHQALTLTLNLNVNVENLRMRAFHKKIPENSLNSMNKLANEIENSQKILEEYKLVKVYKRPQISQRNQIRSQTPSPNPILMPLNNNCLQQIVRISNSRLCSSRAGYTENSLKMIADIEKSVNIRQFSEKNILTPSDPYKIRQASNNTILRKDVFITNPLGKSVESRSNEYLTKNQKIKTENFVSKLLNPEMAIKMKALNYKKIKSDKNAALLSKIRHKLLINKIT